MTLQEDLKADLIRDEGWVRHCYLDSEGYWTIGVGFLIDKRKGGGLRDEEIDFILENRMRVLGKELTDKFPSYWLHPEIVRRALFNMAWQMGVHGLLRFRNMLAALEARNYQEAASEALRSKYARQTPERAERVAALIREGG